MASTRYIEVEHGTFTGVVHAHDGYYAGDFGRRTGMLEPQSVSSPPAAPSDERPHRRR